MDKIIKEAFLSSIDNLRNEVEDMPISLWTESVFRYGFCRAIAKTRKQVELFIECDRIDLVLSSATKRAFVEFKFYSHPKRFHSYGEHKPNAFKGGPGEKNLGEFKACIRKLHDRNTVRHLSKYVILVYTDPTDGSRPSKRYSTYYDNYKHPENDVVISKILASDPFETREGVVKGKLFKIGK